MTTSTDFQTQRVLSDIQSGIARLDASVRAARRALPRPGGLVARMAYSQLLAKSYRRQPADVAAQIWPKDHELRAAVALDDRRCRLGR